MADDSQADGDPQAVAHLTSRLLQGMRRDHAAVIERQSLLKAINDVRHAVDLLARETRNGLSEVRSDITSLENQNFPRHGELLNIMRRMDERGFEALTEP